MTGVRFSSWAQTAVGQATITTDGAGDLPVATFEPGMTLNHPDGTMSELKGPSSMKMMGPESVARLDPAVVVRTDPAAGAGDVEDNYLASVELRPIEIPWMFTPARPDAKGRLRPWIVLVVVEVDTSRLTLGEPTPFLSVGTDQLPDLSDSWAWAHVQRSDIAGEQVARLLCPRRLSASTRYRACIVPSFTFVPASQSYQPAWRIGAAQPANLPVYYSWEFGTGESGDFEDLIRRLGPAPDDRVGGLGAVIVDIRKPWSNDNPLVGAPQPAPLAIPGALGQLDRTSTAGPAFPATVFTDFIARLAEQCNAAAGLLHDGTVAAVAPPIYGGLHVNRATIPPTPAGAADWLDELNEGIPTRIAAGLGAEYVRANQETLMARAWEQVGAIREANRRRSMGQLATAVSEAMHQKHVSTLNVGDAIALAAPAAARIRPWADNGPSLATAIAVSVMPTAAGSSSFARFVRPDGPIARATDVRASTVVSRALAGAVAVPATAVPSMAVPVTPPAAPPPPGATATVAVQAELSVAAAGRLIMLQAYADTARATGLTAAADLLTANLSGLGVDTHAVRSGNLDQLRRSIMPQLALVTTGIANAFSGFTTSTGLRPGAAVTATGVQFDTGSLQSQIISSMHPGDRIARRLAAEIDMPARFGDPMSLTPVMDHPEFPAPMALALLSSAPNWFLPGIAEFPAESTTLLGANGDFIESFLVGLAHEFNRELLWREFPTDMRGTPFTAFWPRTDGAADIPPIHTWSGHLGSHMTLGAEDISVLLVRGTVVRRFPNMVVAAAPALPVQPGQQLTADVNPANWQAPLFVIPIDAQTIACAFGIGPDVLRAAPTDAKPGWFFAFQEHSSRIRFGFDIANAGFGSWSDLDWLRILAASPDGGRGFARADVALAGPTNPVDMQWNSDATDIARITLQKPFRMLIHASELVGR
jgi:hypothetical protein